MVIVFSYLGCLTVYRICVLAMFGCHFHLLFVPDLPSVGQGARDVHVCFFFLFLSRGYWRDCFGKETLMNLHVDMSIYGVYLFVVDALVFRLIDSTTIIEPFSFKKFSDSVSHVFRVFDASASRNSED